VYEAVTLVVPDDVPAGIYSMVGVRERPTGRSLRVGDSDLPAGRRSVLGGMLTLER
jgi:hypothetical protein